MTLFRTEGIITQVINFQDHDRIASVFTGDRGFVKFIVKESLHSKQGIISPLTRAEFIYVKGKSNLLKSREFSTLSHFLSLRNNLASLEAAGEMLNALQKSQLPDTPAPSLYQILLYFLEAMPHAATPLTFASSFYLKILRHDGLFGIPHSCTDEEAEMIQTLAFTRSIQQLASFEISTDLRLKIKSFFDSNQQFP